MLLIQTLTRNVIHDTSTTCENRSYFSHLSDQLAADRIQPGLDALLTLRCVLGVNRKVKAQKVVHRSGINQSVILCEESQ